MKKTYNVFLAVAMFFITSVAFSQGTITGKVVDEAGPLPGASVLVKGTTNGTSTNFNGEFTLNVSTATGTIEISYVGFATKSIQFNVSGGTQNLGTVALDADNSLDEVVIVGVVDIAKERETPVAVSTIKAQEIVERLGNQELPELLNATPSVYATKSGGGFGDSRINIRGFDQRNTAVLINGVPVNDMENGAVFWSNWTGLADVASAIQVQRGLGSSKLAISSVGGTLNIVTKTTDRNEGGFVGTTLGNDNYLKTIASYSTGRMENGFAFTGLFSRVAGDGYIDGTAFEGYNYFLGFGWSNEKRTHDVQFTVTGAPQVHNQRTTSFFNAATLAQYLQYGDKYNYNNGTLNGEEFNWRRNFYHKPVLSLNWDWDISDKTKLSSVAYASFGRGGGTGDIGRGRTGGGSSAFASSLAFRDAATGLVKFDEIVRWNAGEATSFTGTGDSDILLNQPDANGNNFVQARSNGIVRRASINSHNWFGLLANLNTQLNDNLTLDIGFDARTYKGFHYRRLDNLLGADGYIDNGNVNNPNIALTNTYSSNFSSIVNVFKDIDNEDKIDYYNIGYVRWLGIFGQLEYKKDDISAFVQFSGANQAYSREDLFLLTPAEGQRTDWENILGGTIKGGLNYNINENHNVFANAGYYSKQPLFDAVYLNNTNELNEDIRNEKVFGVEIGYGYQSEKLSANVNLYRTSWKDRFQTIFGTFPDPDDPMETVQGRTNVVGIEQVHMGFELETTYRPLDFLTFRGMLSIGNWEYGGTVSGPAFDTNDQNRVVGENTLFLDNVKVGNAAQTTMRLAGIVEPVKNLKFDVAWFRADNLYADIRAEDFDVADNRGSLQLPAYNLFDGGISYLWLVGKEKQNRVNFRLNVNNLFNTTYIVESQTNIFADPGDDTYDGINTANKAFFGFGRTWNFSVRYTF
ncbi:TonB-dependent receptor-like protein [Kordia periserrulae]|uniref:TonB-dependent receptor-like protein n=1 Tax=Kordia periserrulae TaxID=701523 RepID=A0A2T6BVU7_9FLAO|nr:TonB-dependent receptor [Kordia periserrulae]PTX60189.1 TonB-dependent receptor-like protein [Kordia periserrulae]